MTLAILAESNQSIQYTKNDVSQDTTKEENVFVGRHAQVLSVLTHLVTTVTKELEGSNKTLEIKNEEINQANEELKTINEQLDATNSRLAETLQEVWKQREIIQEKNQNMMDSIHYAKRIQTAILPSNKYFEQFFRDYFIFYRPRDIVSGDFYWFAEQDWKIWVAVVDCTGHGVPGAFMSLMGYNLLNRVVKEQKAGSPNIALQNLDNLVRESLKQDENRESNDGMNICLVMFDIVRSQLKIASAQRPAYFFQEDYFFEIKGSKLPIGGHTTKTKIFEEHIFDYQPGDRLYLFSDGITDQFGGTNKRKFTTQKFKQLVQHLQTEKFSNQHHIFETTFDNWRGKYEQLDDVMLIGIEL